ncbi:unnamed protein product [Didymodactylos carnosus]|uniref:Uncharacterized protein n=1 Tax=Didymodactylos carnosus TaxID=1234261 RepID=A0A8S2KH58_9BILA|nr:unnamed protein product [Didymodactylos carnosus]CAF3841745.1 unnamed protein product [Didymodactylos carnosus]
MTTTFNVSEVEPCIKEHSPAKFEEELQRWMPKQQQPLFPTLEKDPSVKPTQETLLFENGQTNYPLIELDHRVKNAFIATIYKAYCEHYRLELSVEDFWVAIAQGVSIHLNENVEKFRSLFVSHGGQKELTLVVDSLRIPDSERPSIGNKNVPGIDWPQAVNQMGELIKKDMKTDFAQLMTIPFSQTSPIEQAVFDCTLMDSVKAYYSCRFNFRCGLPEVTLRGSADDWQSVIDRVNTLKAYFGDFHWWFDSILPHLEKLKESAQGKPDKEWWSKICHHVGGGSGVSVISGWLADFVPYADDGKGHYTKARHDHRHYSQGLLNGIDFSDLKESVTQIDFLLDDNGHITKMKLISGFLGVAQNPETKALRPSMGWLTAVKQEC